MKMKKMIISLIVIMMFFLTSTQIVSLADVTLDTDITSNNIVKQFNPNGEDGDIQGWASPITNFLVKNISNKVLTIIQVIGGILTILAVALYGFISIVGVDQRLSNDLFGATLPGRESPNFRMNLQDVLRRVIIGSILLFASGTIVKAVMLLLLK